MSERLLNVVFDGPDMAAGTMDVFQLAPALLSAAGLITRSNELLNGPDSVATVRVDAQFHKGSFGVTLQVIQDVKEHAEAVLPSLGLLTASGLIENVFGAVEKGKEVISGAMKLYRLVKGEKPDSVLPNRQTRLTAVNFGSGSINQIIVTPETARLYDDDQFRELMGRMAAPLKTVGIDSLEIKSGDDVIEELREADLPETEMATDQFELPDDIPVNPKREMLVRIVKPNFDGGRWSFSDGSSKLGATVEDKDFLEQVARREIGFFKGDTLRIQLRTSQHIDANNRLITENVVEKVLEVRQGTTQRLLT